MKIAIVGSGIAGLAVAHELYQQHDITLFEAESHIGGHVHTHDVTMDGRSYAIDSGFIVFNNETYPQFIQLLKQLNVTSQATKMSFAVSCDKTGLEYQGSGFNGLFANRRNLVNPKFWGMLRDIVRFNREAVNLLQDSSEEMSLGDYFTQHRYSALFRDYYILPMGAAIWSTDPDKMLNFPARFFVRFFLNHGLLSILNRPVWRVIQSGSKTYVEPLIAPFRDRVRTNTPVLNIQRDAQGVDITHQNGTERFDAVFLACHSDQALKLLNTPTTAEHEVLAAIPYQSNEAVLHTDTRLLPKRPQAQAAWNYLMPEGAGGRVCLTYNMNILQGIQSEHTFCVTLNATEQIDPNRIIKRMTYTHPLFTLAGEKAKTRQREINGTQRTYYCGAWWRNGFHEDGLVSGRDAVQHFLQDFNLA
ncbi:FAD-dependent oxidoreductase [Candidatus Albibeggiatoa sp. nov. NOAA]|uniref:NAD(P)/FAD-dependent oxidoreductase n=1 Tax=Candidatus Albibeggiatoa sp. nov. NOAA TaxID=3162724 RepID=UPI0032F263A9|nr:FAD-dependent oxidoreductase [Thiotrichaceae bacterium]